MTNARELNLKLTVDGSEFTEKGVALMVTNSGNTGIGDLAVLPGISITDGLLDVVLLRDVDIFSILKVAGSTLLQTDTDAYRHWSGKHVIIELEEEHAYVCDDGEASARVLDIRVVPHSINMVVPA